MFTYFLGKITKSGNVGPLWKYLLPEWGLLFLKEMWSSQLCLCLIIPMFLNLRQNDNGHDHFPYIISSLFIHIACLSWQLLTPWRVKMSSYPLYYWFSKNTYKSSIMSGECGFYTVSSYSE